ncbi:hypothetical protein B484DRAFT_453083 [Ochromonadaceae sp. CCMP2298]|nr:hypothetical protein B484DRAFT_454683 [Ochromonadaceae sp. CCMP2298]KAJ1420491.1 hypothetical protein B484DRAFT_453083 [Ochromonadaceae sp. CCMP2298]
MTAALQATASGDDSASVHDSESGSNSASGDHAAGGEVEEASESVQDSASGEFTVSSLTITTLKGQLLAWLEPDAEIMIMQRFLLLMTVLRNKEITEGTEVVRVVAEQRRLIAEARAEVVLQIQSEVPQYRTNSREPVAGNELQRQGGGAWVFTTGGDLVEFQSQFYERVRADVHLSRCTSDPTPATSDLRMPRGAETADTAAKKAALKGHLQILQWLRENDTCPWTTGLCSSAAEGGQLEVLQWLRAQNPPCPWNEGVCSKAAQNGHLHVLQWLRAQDPPCPWDELSCAFAAMGGHFEVLQWLRAQDPPCPWNEGVYSKAAQNGILHVLQWLRAQDPPCHWDDYIAAKKGHVEVLEWLRAQEHH